MPMRGMRVMNSWMRHMAKNMWPIIVGDVVVVRLMGWKALWLISCIKLLVRRRSQWTVVAEMNADLW